MRCPRAWPRKPCPGRPVEKAPRPTKGLRMKSVASAPEGQGVITLAGRRGRGPHRISTAVERRKASWSSLRPARALSQEHAPIPLRRYGAPLPLLGKRKSGRQTKTRAGFPAARTNARDANLRFAIVPSRQFRAPQHDPRSRLPPPLQRSLRSRNSRARDFLRGGRRAHLRHLRRAVARAISRFRRGVRRNGGGGERTPAPADRDLRA